MTNGPHVPLCVDLDGTLVRTDMLHEVLLSLIKSSPIALLRLPQLLAKGKAKFKIGVAGHVTMDPKHLPYNEDVVALINSARSEGRIIILATAAPSRIARAVADDRGYFDDVICTDDSVNLSGQSKADALSGRFGAGGYDYVGNHRDDLPIFNKARHAYLVSSSLSLRRSAARQKSEITFIDAPQAGISVWLRALRVHQWMKNALIFVPLVAAQKIDDIALIIAAILAFVSFSLCASTVYIVNDLLDLAADRAHRSKYRRPFASGALSVASGVIAVPFLLLASLLIALSLPHLFLAVLIGYAIATTAYSFALKRQVIVDVTVLAGLYTIRILAGSAATNIVPSFWLLAFSMFLFLCLAMVKRYSELSLAVDKQEQLVGRGYMASDLPVILTLGASSGMVSALVLALYTQSTIIQENFLTPQWLWLLPPLMLYWVARLWLKAGRGEVDDDPVVFAAKDWQSLLILSLMGLAFLLGGVGWWPL